MRYLIGLPVCLVAISGFLWFTSHGTYRLGAQDGEDAAALESKNREANDPNSQSQARSSSSPDDSASAAFDPIAISGCTLTPIQEQTVASQLDGLLTEVHVTLGAKVEKNARLAQIDDQKLRLQIELLRIKADSNSAEKIAQAMFEEADAKVKYAEKANAGVKSSVPELELKTYQAQRERFFHEIKKASEDRAEARKELEKTAIHLGMHQIHSGLNGEVVKVFKKAGETVKQGEPLFRLARMDRLLIEGFCKVQHASSLKAGQRVLAHAELQGSQLVALIGHTAPVNQLAMASDGKLLASASDDGNVLLWSWPSGTRVAALHHPAGVCAVDVVPIADGQKTKYLIVTGGEDRVIRVWTYSNATKAQGPHLELAGHEASVRSVCISADGKNCLTGGDDRRLGWWDIAAATGNAKRDKASAEATWIYSVGAWKQTAHQGAVTRTHIAKDGTIISTGSDNVHKVWQIDGSRSKLLKVHRGRSGDVPRLDVSRDGTRLLLDHGDELRVLNRDSGVVLGAMQNTKHVRFEEFACFSPTQRLVLAASADGRLQLWKTPVDPKDGAANLVAFHASPAADSLPNLGGFEVRHYPLPKASQARSGVFAPDESVFFTAGTDRVIRVWNVPPPADWEPRPATLTYVGSELESGTDLVRIQAELENPADVSRWWRPGSFVNLKGFPAQP